jgi:hypothetical protein
VRCLKTSSRIKPCPTLSGRDFGVTVKPISLRSRNHALAESLANAAPSDNCQKYWLSDHFISAYLSLGLVMPHRDLWSHARAAP